MTAIEFVKAMGLNAVKQFLENDNIRTKEMHDELKRIVESYELINSLGGYEKAKKAFDELCEHKKDLITCSRVVLTKNELSNDGTLDDNNMKHCCFCGGKIEAQEQSHESE